jgi:hypothetical protein
MKKTLILIFSFFIILTLTGSVFGQDVGSEMLVVFADEEPGGQYSSASLFGNDVLITNPALPEEMSPSIVSTPDGTLYVAVSNRDFGTDFGKNNGISVFRSTNGGSSWSLRFDIYNDSRNLHYPAITYGENSEGKFIYVAYGSPAATNHSVKVCRIDTVNSVARFIVVESGIYMGPNNYPISPSICTDNIEYPENYYVYVTYAKYASDHYKIMFSRSLDRGLTYSTPKDITGLAKNSSHASHPDIAYGDSGLFVAFEKMGDTLVGWITKPWVTKSTDWGSNFDTPVQINYSSYVADYPSIAVAHDSSSVVVAYTQQVPDASNKDVAASYSTNSGDRWYYVTLENNPDSDEYSIDLAVSHSSGRFHAVFKSVQSNYINNDWIHINNVIYTFADVDTPGSWSSGIIVNDSGDGSFPTVCVNPTQPLDKETVNIAWVDHRGTGYAVYFDKIVDELCASNSDCDAEDYCYKEACDDVFGICAQRPFCLPTLDLVCGCNGITYFNACDAAEDGTSVDYEGECYCDSSIVIPTPIGGRGTQIISGNTSGENNDAVPSCRSTSTAPDDLYVFTLYIETIVTASVIGFDTVLHLRQTCDDPGSELACNDNHYPPGSNGSLISATLTPGEYFLIVDGYGSSSGAYQLTVVFEGLPCASNSDCNAGDTCYKEACDDALGTCMDRPFDCGIIAGWPKVCGCNGVTYKNSCFAAEDGVNIDYEGECISMDPGIYGNVSGSVQEGVYMLLYSTSCGEDTLEDYVITAADGSYSFTGLSNGSYKVKPLMSGYAFSPVEQIINFTNTAVTGQDFISY